MRGRGPTKENPEVEVGDVSTPSWVMILVDKWNGEGSHRQLSTTERPTILDCQVGRGVFTTCDMALHNRMNLKRRFNCGAYWKEWFN